LTDEAAGLSPGATVKGVAGALSSGTRLGLPASCADTREAAANNKTIWVSLLIVADWTGTQ